MYILYIYILFIYTYILWLSLFLPYRFTVNGPYPLRKGTRLAESKGRWFSLLPQMVLFMFFHQSLVHCRHLYTCISSENCLSDEFTYEKWWFSNMASLKNAQTKWRLNGKIICKWWKLNRKLSNHQKTPDKTLKGKPGHRQISILFTQEKLHRTGLSDIPNNVPIRSDVPKVLPPLGLSKPLATATGLQPWGKGRCWGAEMSLIS